jgi:hypothetical protein
MVPIVYQPTDCFIVPDAMIFGEDDVDTLHEKTMTMYRVRYGAKMSRNLDQITWYFETRLPQSLPNWLKTRAAIKDFGEQGWEFVGEYNASGIAAWIPDADRDALKARIAASPDDFETVFFWMDDDFIRAWVFRRPDKA